MGNISSFYDSQKPLENDPRVSDYWKGCLVYKLYEPHIITYEVKGEGKKTDEIQFAVKIPKISIDLYLSLKYVNNSYVYELYVLSPYDYSKFCMHMTISNNERILSHIIYGANTYDNYKGCSGLEGLMFIRYNILEYFHNTNQLERFIMGIKFANINSISFTDAAAIPIKFSNRYKFVFYERLLNRDIPINRISIYDKYTKNSVENKETENYISSKVLEARKLTYGDLKDIMTCVDLESTIKASKGNISDLEPYILGVSKPIDYTKYSDNMLLYDVLQLSERLERNDGEMRFVDLFYRCCSNIMDGLTTIKLYRERHVIKALVDVSKIKCYKIMDMLDDIWDSHQSLKKIITYDTLADIFAEKELL